MSQFEYVSIAVALVYSFALARLIGGLPHLGREEGRSWIALAWDLSMILGCLSSWWIFWRFQAVDWTALRFVWIIAFPSLIYLRAAVLLTDEPSQVRSWGMHFFEVRRRFYGIGLAQGGHTFFLPWMMGVYAWGTPAPAHAAALPILLFSIAGLATSRPAVHLALALLTIGVVMLALFLSPV